MFKVKIEDWYNKNTLNQDHDITQHDINVFGQFIDKYHCHGKYLPEILTLGLEAFLNKEKDDCGTNSKTGRGSSNRD